MNLRNQSRRQQRGGANNFESLLVANALNEFIAPSNRGELDVFIEMLAKALERGEHNLVLETVRTMIENYNEQLNTVFPILTLVDALVQQSGKSLQNTERLNQLNTDFKKQYQHLDQ